MAEARLYSRSAFLVLVLIAATTSVSQAQTQAETLRVRPLVKDGQVLVSFALDGGLTDEGHPFLVTTFVMAAPLADLDAARTSHDMSRQLLEQAGAALRTLHDAGLAHGRVRASTILVRRTGGGATAVVTGFAPLDRLPTLSEGIADDLEQLQRLASTLRV